MIFTDLLQPEVQQFIVDNTDTDVRKLALAKNPFSHVLWTDVLNQIAARKKALTKLPTWFNTPNIIYPSKISVEQTSSEITAEYKSGLVKGSTLVDLTGGFGVDSYYFSKKVHQVFHCEKDAELQTMAAHNFLELGAKNISSHAVDSEFFLKNSGLTFDWIFVDPSRRSGSGRVFMLTDCEPNVTEHLPSYFRYSANILIKAAPLLDITAALAELQFVSKIHIVAVENDVKELLFEISKDHLAMPITKTVNLRKDSTDVFEFTADNNVCDTSVPKTYLYEPNAAIMKSGGFEQVGISFDVSKLHRHSHLYTSDTLRNDFPGRIFSISENLPYNKTGMKRLERMQANITTRNFPDSVDAIRKKWKIKDGGNQYCFFTTNHKNEKIVLICTKIN